MRNCPRPSSASQKYDTGFQRVCASAANRGHPGLFLVGLSVLAVTGPSCRPAGEQSNSKPLENRSRSTDIDSPANRLTAFVSIPPQAYFLRRVSGDRVNIEVLVQPGQSPHTYEPTPKQLAGLAQADVYFRIGVPFENRIIEKLASTFRGLRVVDTRQGITLRPMEERHDAEHGDDHAHEAGRPDPHIWLDPRLVKVQAATMGQTLAVLDPGHAGEYERRLHAFEADLDAIHAKLTEALAPLKGAEFFVYHPAFGYFADAYGLKQVAVEVGGKEPSQKNLVSLIEQAKARDVRVIFVQPQFASSSAQRIAEAIGGVVVPLDPQAEDYLRNLDDMAAKIEQALRPAASAAETD